MAPQPYYPGTTNARGVSLPQSPESGSQGFTSSAQGKVASAVWKSSRPEPDAEGGKADPKTVSLVSHTSQVDKQPFTPIGPSGEPTILIPETAVQPSEPVELVLGGMRAHDLTGAVPREQPSASLVAASPSPTALVASATLPTPAVTQVIHVAPSTAQTAAANGARAAAASTTPGNTSSGLVEMTDLPPTAAETTTNRSLQRVRGFEPPSPAVAPVEAAPETFISPQMTISASPRETRDAVAAAAIESEPAIVKPAPGAAPGGWKSRYSTDEI
jgi:hypothetical protein